MCLSILNQIHCSRSVRFKNCDHDTIIQSACEKSLLIGETEFSETKILLFFLKKGISKRI